MSTRRLRSGRAFTLIEVLVALSVLALSCVVLGSAYVGVLLSYQNLSRDTLKEEDLRYAVSLILVETNLENIEAGGQFEGVRQRKIRWKAEVEPTSVADLFDVVLTIEADDLEKGGVVKSTQKLRLLRPTWSEETDRQTLRDAARKRIEELNKSQ